MIEKTQTSDERPATSEERAVPEIEVRDLKMSFGSFVVMQDLNFSITPGEIFIIMGGSGSGKSTLLRHLIGLMEPTEGDILYRNQSFVRADEKARQRQLRRFGVLYQDGALWSTMTLAENVALPMQLYTDLQAAEIEDLVAFKLALVGLRGFQDFYPAEISGGMRKRAALARALALDPDVLFFDEPSAGLDPITSRRLDDLILQLRDSLGTTIVVVTHVLESIFAIGDRAVFLDIETKTITADGNPHDLRDHAPNETVHNFLTRTS